MRFADSCLLLLIKQAIAAGGELHPAPKDYVVVGVNLRFYHGGFRWPMLYYSHHCQLRLLR